MQLPYLVFNHAGQLQYVDSLSTEHLVPHITARELEDDTYNSVRAITTDFASEEMYSAFIANAHRLPTLTVMYIAPNIYEQFDLSDIIAAFPTLEKLFSFEGAFQTPIRSNQLSHLHVQMGEDVGLEYVSFPRLQYLDVPKLNDVKPTAFAALQHLGCYFWEDYAVPTSLVSLSLGEADNTLLENIITKPWAERLQYLSLNMNLSDSVHSLHQTLSKAHFPALHYLRFMYGGWRPFPIHEALEHCRLPDALTLDLQASCVCTEAFTYLLQMENLRHLKHINADYNYIEANAVRGLIESTDYSVSLEYQLARYTEYE